jgi:hypothetical protein
VFKKILYNGIPNIAVWRMLRKRLRLKSYELSIVQHVEHLERWIVCKPLSRNVFVILATQLHLECNCKARFETPYIVLWYRNKPIEAAYVGFQPRWLYCIKQMNSVMADCRFRAAADCVINAFSFQCNIETAVCIFMLQMAAALCCAYIQRLMDYHECGNSIEA